MFHFLLTWPVALHRFRDAVNEARADIERDSDPETCYVVLHADGGVSLETTWTLSGNDHAYSYAETNAVRALVVHDAIEPAPGIATLAVATASALYLDPIRGALARLRCRRAGGA